MPGLPQEVIEELANRALEAERQLRQQRRAAKSQEPSTIRVKVASQPTFTRYVFDDAGRDQCRARARRRKADARFRSADQMGSGGCQGGHAADAEIDRRRRRLRFGRRHFLAQRHAAGAHVPRGPQHRGRCRPRRRQPQAGGARGRRQAGRRARCRAGHRSARDRARAGCRGDRAAAEGRGRAVRCTRCRAAAGESGRKFTAGAESERRRSSRSPQRRRAPTGCAESGTPKPSATAERKRPAPNPDAAVVVELQQSGDALRAEFPFAVATPAAIFQRADTLWLVFDSAAKIDLAAFAADTGHAIRNAVLERGADGEAIVRIKLERPRLVSLEPDGPGWIVTIGDTVTVPSRPLVIARNIVGKNRASIAIPFDNPRQIHRLADRDIGDRLLVITALGPARGFLKGQDFVELRALPSTHGVVLQPLADDVTAELVRRQDLDHASSGTLALADGDRPAAATRQQSTRLELRHPALGLRPPGQVQRPAGRTHPACRHGARSQAPASAAQSRAFLSRARHVGRGQGRARRRARRQEGDRGRHRHRAQGGRRCHARAARRGAQGIVQSAGRQPTRCADLARDRLCPPGQMAGGACRFQERR